MNSISFYSFTNVLPLPATTCLGTVPTGCGRCGALIKQERLLALLEADNERTLDSIKKLNNQAQKTKAA